MKLKFQQVSQKCSQFCIKQFKKEISSLKSSLVSVNKRIFNGENLKADHIKIETIIDHCKDHMYFALDDSDWAAFEGKPFKKFLHLEDVKHQNPLQMLLDSHGCETTSIDEVIDVLHDYYADLYVSKEMTCTRAEIDCLLSGITLLPRLAASDDLGSLITEEEVLLAIKSLHLGKSPGSDGLTTDFYKHFSADIAPILYTIFNECYRTSNLTQSQRLAIIVLIFKKGDIRITGNY